MRHDLVALKRFSADGAEGWTDGAENQGEAFRGVCCPLGPEACQRVSQRRPRIDCFKGIETAVVGILSRKTMVFRQPAWESRQPPIPDSWESCVETMFLEEIKGFSNTGWRLRHRTVAAFRDPRSPQLRRWADLSDVGRRDKAGFCPDR